MERDIRCLCRCCREDYIDAGYTVTLLHPLSSGLCDKCERVGYSVEINAQPTKKKRKRRKRRKHCQAKQKDSALTQVAETSQRVNTARLTK